MTAPTLTTDRLLLAPHEPRDLADMAALFGDPGIAAQIGLAPVDREDCWKRLLRYIGHWETLGYGHWTVRDKSTGAFLGEVGLMDSRRASRPSFEGAPEAAWALTRAAQGRGYAREACLAMLGWADAHGLGRTVCIIAHANAPSIRLAEGLGYRPAGEVSYREAPILFFARGSG